MTETWVDMEGAEAFLLQLKRRRVSEIEALLGAARSSTDPAIRQASAAIRMLESVIEDMEAERGSSDE